MRPGAAGPPANNALRSLPCPRLSPVTMVSPTERATCVCEGSNAAATADGRPDPDISSGHDRGQQHGMIPAAVLEGWTTQACQHTCTKLLLLYTETRACG